jgi:hypothetical protein
MIDEARFQEIVSEFEGYSDDTKLGAVYGTPTIGDFKAILQDAARYRHLRDYRGGHYAMSYDPPQPAEWFIQWEFQQQKPEDRTATFDELIDRDIEHKSIELAEEAQEAEFEAARHSDPCTQEARDHGCTCRLSTVHSNDIDPPEPVIDRDCPLHGNAPDPDYELERKRDDAEF